MTRLSIAINLDRCVGCHTCANACKMQNNVPMGMLWNRILTKDCDVIDGAVGEYPNLKRVYLPVQCQHCETAACQKVCPTGATYKDGLGRVEIDYGDSRVPVRVKGVAEKCTLCKERTDEGDLPMCVRVCPARARTFGDLDDPESEISKLALSAKAGHLLEEKGTHPQLFYVGL